MVFRPLLLLLAFGLTACAPPVDGAVDGYLLSLSWSPQFCAGSGRDTGPQCRQPYGFVVHGLWPQSAQGRPRECPAAGRVSDATIAQMLPIMPSRGLVIHEWRSHGACTGLSPAAYFQNVARAYHGIVIPPDYRAPDQALTIGADALRQAFVDANPELPADGLVLECSGPYLREVRVCLDRHLQPHACGSERRDHCGAQLSLRPVR